MRPPSHRAVVGALVASALACAPAPRPGPSAIPSDASFALPGLGAPVRVVTDRAGVPHVLAASLDDLYLAWGFVAARDRLWQMEHQRRAASGRLSEWVGNAALTADAGARLFELREHAEAAWARDASNPEVAGAVRRYCDGINAYIAECRAGRLPWPAEMRALRRTSEPWTPVDVAVGLYGLAMTLDFAVPEMTEAREIATRGLEWAERRRMHEGEHTYDTVPDSAARRLHAGRPGAARARAAAIEPLPAALVAAAERALAAHRPAHADDPDARASNVFAAGPARSTSGAPLLANDPHLALTAPGPFHVVHLTVPGVVNAIGASVPGLPAIVSGRNADCAWGITALGADVLDLYADSLTTDGRAVTTPRGRAAIREARFDVAFRLPGGVRVPLFWRMRRYTPHGPIIAEDHQRGLALSVRWTALEEPVTLAGLVGLERSRDADEVTRRYANLVTPTINVVAADRAGRVRYRAVGAVPRRAFTPRPGPLPSDGLHEWAGVIAPEAMPAWNVPAHATVVNANNRPIGPAHPSPWPRYDWAHDRALRIAARLDGDRALTLDDMRSVQNDVISRRAARLVPRLLACADAIADSLAPRERAILDSLRAWDFTCRRDRRGPTIYRAWYGALQRLSGLGALDGLAAAALDGRAPWALEEPAPVAALSALRLAMAGLDSLLGPDPDGWTWGRAHQARFRHGLAKVAPGFEERLVPVDGENGTVAVGASRLPWTTEVTHGPTFRHLVDLADSTRSWAVFPPGNSGERGSRHADDHVARWANHGDVALLLAWRDVERARVSEWRLEAAR